MCTLFIQNEHFYAVHLHSFWVGGLKNGDGAFRQCTSCRFPESLAGPKHIQLSFLAAWATSGWCRLAEYAIGGGGITALQQRGLPTQ